MQAADLSGVSMTRKVVLELLWATTILAVHQVGMVAQKIDHASVLFIIYLPCVFLFSRKRVDHAFFALLCFLATSSLLFAGSLISAQRFAILAFYFLALATIQGLRETT